MTSETATETKAAAARHPNPKDSMKSTWRTADKKTWTIHHKLLDWVDVHPTILGKPPPVFQKTDPIPYLPHWEQHALILYQSFIVLALHQAFTLLTGITLPPIVAGIYYTVAFDVIVIREAHLIRRLAYVYGYLDGDVHPRDEIPDAGVHKIATVLNKVTGARMALHVFFTYNRNQLPFDVMLDGKWWLWLIIEMSLYPIAIDFWFYWYHRAMHVIPGLWQFHRTHHLTKHPNALFSAYADHVQEFFDIVGIPLLAYGTLRLMGINMGFFDWWIAQQYVAFVEVGGHSGLRVHFTPPNPLDPILTYFGMELALEDHDLHHRKGWRKSHNYGKQSRVWDRIFGTCTDRIESVASNVDYENTATMIWR